MKLISALLKILMFLNFANNDVDAAFARCEKYVELKQSMPEFFTNRDPESDEIKAKLESCVYASLPVSPKNNMLILHKIRTSDPKDFNFEEAVKVFIMSCEVYSFSKGPRDGNIFIYDLEGASFSHMFRTSLSSIRKALRFLQEGSPYDLREVHIMNCFSAVDYMLPIIKPFLRADLLQKVHFHPKNMDMEKFYEKHIPKSHLPSDYGGDLESIEELHQKQIKLLNIQRQYFIVEERISNGEFDKHVDEINEVRMKTGQHLF